MQRQHTRFSSYRRFVVEVARENGRRVVRRVGDGKRRPEPNVVIPSELRIDELAGFPDDVYHEPAQPGDAIERIDWSRASGFAGVHLGPGTPPAPHDSRRFPGWRTPGPSPPASSRP